ncbi:MAG: hypothetical protein IKO93_23050 [Lentisphaeria bacterium]|nr:hypothetical protein [Lentisphaeria bacterium]
MPGSLKDNWDEFDWEKELRKDDERVAAYMDELPRYIDLPSEDAVIMKHLKEKPGLVPPDGDSTARFWTISSKMTSNRKTISPKTGRKRTVPNFTLPPAGSPGSGPSFLRFSPIRRSLSRRLRSSVFTARSWHAAAT